MMGPLLFIPASDQSPSAKPNAGAPWGNRCPLSRDLNAIERVSVAHRVAPWVVNFPPGNTKDGCDAHPDHSQRATNGYYA